MALYNNQTDDVSFKHPEYFAHINQVSLIDSVYNGVDTAKEHLFKAPKESTTSYEDRKTKCTLKNYVKRAIEAYVGMIFRRQVQAVGYSDKVQAIANKIDKKNPISRFARDLTSTLIKDGKVFLAADTPIGGGDPYAVIIPRNNVINWRKSEAGNYTLVVIEESIIEQAGDFGLEVIEQWRVFKEDGDIDIYRRSKDGIYLYTTIETDFNYIPIIDLEIDETPPLYDIARMTIKHMSRTSFKDKYLDMSAVPIPLIWGASNDVDDGAMKPVYVIGVDEAFIFTGTKDEADFQWRELSGSSIEQLQKDLDVIESDITSGVIKVATSETTTIKTATESYYESSESANRVTVIASTVEIGLNRLMQMIADLMNETVDIAARVIVNKDFNALVANGQDTRLLWEMYLGGALSYQSFMKSMESYELVDIGSVEEEQKRIETETFTPAPRNAPEETITQIDNNTLSVM